MGDAPEPAASAPNSPPPETLELRVVQLQPAARLPERQSEHASGFDLHACLPDGPLRLGTSPLRVPTGIAIAAPVGTDVQIRPRSGLLARGVVAGFGTLDADYRGEIFVTMYCLPDTESYEIVDGERIAQLVISRLADVAWSVAGDLAELEPTERGAGGHGSTGRL